MGSHPPGPLEPEKRGPTKQGKVQPAGTEVESARLLANDASIRLPDHGSEQLRVLADRFIAEDRGTTVDEFVDWVMRIERA